MHQRTLYLHIGVHKTGTTSIQNFLALNRSVLRKKGYLYPGRNIAHHKMGFEMEELDPVSPDYSGCRETHAIWKKVVRSGVENVILSSENFGRYETATKLIGFIRANIPEGMRIKVIMYCRRQDYILQSAYQQIVKGRVTFPFSFDKYLELHERDWDYRKRLEPWAEAFGKENIIVRCFEREQMPSGLISDFLQTVGLSLTDEFSSVSPSRSNIGFSYDLNEFIRINNIAGKENEDLHRFLISFARKFNSRSVNERYTYMSPQRTLEVLNYYAPSNEFVARNYLGRDDGILFYEPPPDIREEREPFQGLELEKAIPLITQLLMYVDQKNSAHIKRFELLVRIDRFLFGPVRNKPRIARKEKRKS